MELALIKDKLRKWWLRWFRHMQCKPRDAFVQIVEGKEVEVDWKLHGRKW